MNKSDLTNFSSTVYEETFKLRSGETDSYGEIAGRIDNPGAAQAVGQALKRNPFSLIVPCHRVVRADGSLGGYAGNEFSSIKGKIVRLESQSP